MPLAPAQDSWPALQDLLDHLGPRDLYTVSDLESAGKFLFSHAYSRRYLQETARQYALVLGQTLETRTRRNFSELVLTPAQFTDLLAVFRDSRSTPMSVNELLMQRRQRALQLQGDLSPDGEVMTMAELGENVNRLIIETMECKERASGAEDAALSMQKELAQVKAELAQANAKLNELLSLLRR